MEPFNMRERILRPSSMLILRTWYWSKSWSRIHGRKVLMEISLMNPLSNTDSNFGCRWKAFGNDCVRIVSKNIMTIRCRSSVVFVRHSTEFSLGLLPWHFERLFEVFYAKYLSIVLYARGSLAILVDWKSNTWQTILIKTYLLLWKNIKEEHFSTSLKTGLVTDHLALVFRFRWLGSVLLKNLAFEGLLDGCFWV